MGNKIGLYGLGVMGQSLARNIHSKNHSISVYNRNKEVLHTFVNTYQGIEGYDTLEEFVHSLEKPRKIILMVADFAVDDVIKALIPLLQRGDILLDCGNTFYKETQRRQEELESVGIHFIGSGVSGGEMGALLGPSIMPSGNAEAYQSVKDILESIAAHNEDGSACCTYIGKGGSGHFVKMVHNGIEYADMQVIAEAYEILKDNLQSQEEIIQAWDVLRSGKLKSYLMDITYEILCHKEEGEYLLPYISDLARQKGTGKWTSQISFDFALAIPSLTEAVQVRFLSSEKLIREQLSDHYKKDAYIPYEGDLLQDLEDALYTARISTYAQGLHLIHKVSLENDYQIDMKEVARIWQNGCIIKSVFLQEIIRAYMKDAKLEHLLLSDVLSKEIKQCNDGARRVLLHAIKNKCFTPVLSSSVQYLDGMCTKYLSTNLLQAQRDFFGAHTYERTDKEGTFHTKWE
ncbi:NADP-dependent phosphogluconate dehydrogenase [Amedibacillus sp. YH-ame10]